MKEKLIMNPGIADNNEETLETTLRPQLLEEYIGQTKVKESMKVYIEAAKKREEALDHVLLYGPLRINQALFPQRCRPMGCHRRWFRDLLQSENAVQPFPSS